MVKGDDRFRRKAHLQNSKQTLILGLNIRIKKIKANESDAFPVNYAYAYA